MDPAMRAEIDPGHGNTDALWAPFAADKGLPPSYRTSRGHATTQSLPGGQFTALALGALGTIAREGLKGGAMERVDSVPTRDTGPFVPHVYTADHAKARSTKVAALGCCAPGV